VLHSSLSPSQRIAEWRRILRGEARFVIGARSAIFAPMENIGLIIIDEEHESSYKSGSTPRYHARQIAMHRAAGSGARLVMGSATPSVEAWHVMNQGSLKRLNLTRRLSGGAMPSMEIVNIRGSEGSLSPRLTKAVRETLAQGRQVILFLNRRGFGYFYHCRSCGRDFLLHPLLGQSDLP
jgi:primosomal protein N' (replication factor Y)